MSLRRGHLGRDGKEGVTSLGEEKYFRQSEQLVCGPDPREEEKKQGSLVVAGLPTAPLERELFASVVYPPQQGPPEVVLGLMSKCPEIKFLDQRVCTC